MAEHVAEIETVTDRYGTNFTHAAATLRVYNGYVPKVGDMLYLTPMDGSMVKWDGKLRTMQEHLYLITGERDRYAKLDTIERLQQRIAELEAEGTP